MKITQNVLPLMPAGNALPVFKDMPYLALIIYAQLLLIILSIIAMIILFLILILNKPLAFLAIIKACLSIFKIRPSVLIKPNCLIKEYNQK